jgi:hypothetical protein
MSMIPDSPQEELTGEVPGWETLPPDETTQNPNPPLQSPPSEPTTTPQLDPPTTRKPSAQKDENTNPTSSSVSTEVAASLVTIASGLLKLAGTAGAWIAAKRGSKRDVMPTNAEVESVARPAASIMSRHAPDVAGEAGDLMDGIEAATGVAAYGVRVMVNAPGGMTEAAQAQANPLDQGTV